jgi:hypothetical protein
LRGILSGGLRGENMGNIIIQNLSIKRIIGMIFFYVSVLVIPASIIGYFVLPSIASVALIWKSCVAAVAGMALGRVLMSEDAVARFYRQNCLNCKHADHEMRKNEKVNAINWCKLKVPRQSDDGRCLSKELS